MNGIGVSCRPMFALQSRGTWMLWVPGADWTGGWGQLLIIDPTVIYIYILNCSDISDTACLKLGQIATAGLWRMMMTKSWTCRRRTGHLLLWYCITVLRDAWSRCVTLPVLTGLQAQTAAVWVQVVSVIYCYHLLSISSCEHRLQTSALKHSAKLVKTRPSFQARLASSWWWSQKSLRNTRACHGCEDCVLFVSFLHVSSSCIDARWSFILFLCSCVHDARNPVLEARQGPWIHALTDAYCKFCSSGKDTWFGVEPPEHKRHWQDIVTYCI